MAAMLMLGACSPISPVSAEYVSEPPIAQEPNSKVQVRSCRLGERNEAARDVSWDDLVRNPENYVGFPVRLRGISLIEFEVISLWESVRGGRNVRMSVRELSVQDAADLLACNLKPVYVEGDIKAVHSRGGVGLVIVARAIVGIGGE